MIQSQIIPCPTCSTSIPFDTKQLLMGIQFACPNCHQSIGLASESKPIVQAPSGSFEKVKGKISK